MSDSKDEKKGGKAGKSTQLELPELAKPGLLDPLWAMIPMPVSGLLDRITHYTPDFIARRGMRLMLRDRLREYTGRTIEEQQEWTQKFVDGLKSLPIAIVPDLANEQHYEVPAQFYQLCLGRRLKYSCAYYPTKDTTLDEAEEAMLDLYVQRADLQNGQTILDMGCGWGSFSLYACERFPDSKIVAVSNSSSQKQFIDGEAKKRGFKNLTVVTCDINDLDAAALGVGKAASGSKAGASGKKKGEETKADGKELSLENGFDRIISIEMMEHVKNYDRLLENVSKWLHPQGKLFVHIFTNREYTYHFTGDHWMTKFFFSGGTMPSDHLLFYFQRNLRITKHWRVSGEHYSKTSRDWLALMDKNAKEIKKIFAQAYGKEAAGFWVKWRIFYLAVEECFGYNKGRDWLVSHYLFQHPAATASAVSVPGEKQKDA